MTLTFRKDIKVDETLATPADRTRYVVHPNGAPVVMPKNWLEERQAMHRFFAELHTTLQELKSGTQG